MSSTDVMDIDPVQLGRAGLNALALAGTAIVAHYSALTCTPTGVVDADARMPAEVGDVLARALGAFGDRTEGAEAGDVIQRQATALAAMVEHARLHSGRSRKLAGPDGADGSDGLGVRPPLRGPEVATAAKRCGAAAPLG